MSRSVLPQIQSVQKRWSIIIIAKLCVLKPPGLRRHIFPGVSLNKGLLLKNKTLGSSCNLFKALFKYLGFLNPKIFQTNKTLPLVSPSFTSKMNSL